VGNFNKPAGLAITPDGSTIIVCNSYQTGTSANSVTTIDTATNTVTGNYACGTNPYFCTVTPDGDWVYVTNLSDNTVTVFSVTPGSGGGGSAGGPVVGTIVAPTSSSPTTTKLTYSRTVGPNTGYAGAPYGIAADFSDNGLVVAGSTSERLVDYFTPSSGPNFSGHLYLTPFPGLSTVAKWCTPVFTSSNFNNGYYGTGGTGYLIVTTQGDSVGAWLFNLYGTISRVALAVSSYTFNVPTGVLWGGSNFVYVCNSGNNTVTRYDVYNLNVNATFSVGSTPYGIGGSDFNGVVVANHGTNTVTLLGGSTITVGNGPFDVVSGFYSGNFYVSNFTDNTVSVIKPYPFGVIATLS
jgi:YVTN family beta-propeller protein